MTKYISEAVGRSPSVEEREYLKMLYEENAEHARQYEALRASAASMFIALIAGIIAYGGSDKSKASSVGGAICLVSCLGFIVNYKHFERYELHLNRMRGYKQALERNLSKDIIEIGKSRDAKHNFDNWHVAHWVRLRYLWAAVYIATFIIGLAMIIY